MPHRHTKPAHHPHWAAALDLLAWILLPIFEKLDDLGSWLADMRPDERVHQAARLVIAVTLAVLVIVALTACQPRDTQPGPIQTAANTSAVKVVQP